MSTYICKCGRRVQKSSNADNTGNRLEGYGPGHECYGCPYAMPWGGNEWNETAKRFVQDIKGYECRMSRTLSYGSLFIGSTKDKCTCSVFSLDFDFLEQISTWVKDTFSQGELTGGFSRDEIRPTDYSHNGRYCCTFVCAANKKGISAKAALLARFFNPDGNRKGMTPQQEMEKILTDIKKAKEGFSCASAPSVDAAVTTAENAVPTATAATLTTSESAAAASASTPATSLQNCESGPAVLAESFSAGEAVGGTSSPILTNPANAKTPPASDAPQDKPLTFIREDKCPAFDYSGLTDQTVEDLHFAEDEYRHGKQMAERGLVHMGNAIAAAHDALCGVVAQCDNGEDGARLTMRQARNNQHSEDTFKDWCLSVGVTKPTAYRLLQVSALMAGSSPRQRAILEALPPTLLYAVAKPSAPQELVEKVKNGEVSTNKAYQDLLKENQQLRTDRVNAMNQAEREKQRADAAEAQRDAANADISGLTTRAERAEAERDKARADQLSTAKDCNRLGLKVSQEKDRADKAEAREEEAWKLQSKAETRAQEAEKQLEESRQMAEAAKLRGDKLKAENDALKKQPITAVVDKDEVKRQAEALSRNAVQEARQQAAEAQARLRQYQEDAEGLLAPAQACAQQAQFIADSVRAMYLNWFGSAVAADASLAQMGTPLYAVCGEIMSSLEEENTINPTAAGSEEDAEREALFE